MNDQTAPKDQVQQLQRLWEARIKEGTQRMAQLPADERPREKLLLRAGCLVRSGAHGRPAWNRYPVV